MIKINFSEPLVKVKVKLGIFLYLKLYKRDQLVERTHTLVFRQREDTDKETQSQTEDLAEKTEERVVGSSNFVQLGHTLTPKGVEV